MAEDFTELCVYKLTESTFSIWRDSPQWSMATSFPMFLDYKQRRNIIHRTPLDE
jgi:hypothetical protein